MSEFVDNQGRRWTLRLDIPALRRVRDTLAIHLGKMTIVELLLGPMADPIDLCNLLFVLVQPQAAAAGVSDEEFGRALFGAQVFHDASVALLRSFEDLQPSGEAQDALRSLIDAFVAKMQDASSASTQACLKLAKELRGGAPTAPEAST